MEKKIKDIITDNGNGRLLVTLHKQFYQKESVFYAAHKFTSKCGILIEPLDDFSIGIYFDKKNDAKVDLTELAKCFCNEVLDQQTRLDLERQYGKIRDIIYEQAFRPITKATE
jgi:His-Xaa-Ser system protein HxsD